MIAEEKKYYVSVILPLAVPKQYSYEVPAELVDQVKFGIRVEVPLQSKLYSALVVSIHHDTPVAYKARKIVSAIDKLAIITETQYTFWKWMAAYYCCSIGEVMNVALPSGLKLNSETKLILNPAFEYDANELSDDEYLLTEALGIQNELTINEAKDILNKKSIYPTIRSLLELEAITVVEELIERFKVKKEKFLSLTSYYLEDKSKLIEALELAKKSEKQTNIILAYSKLSRENPLVSKKDIYEIVGTESGAVKALIKKGIFDEQELEVSRLKKSDEDTIDIHPLSEEQVGAVAQIKEHYKTKNQVLLYGVTGSGKTRVYMELMQEVIDAGKQVLFLLPEIALTTQIVHRVTKIFGDEVGVFHSKINNLQRVELWKSCLNGKSILLGARSSMFLPFKDLGLIIIDEEHDPSYKQTDPAPRYNGRDAAIFLANLSGAKVLMGTATPSIETFANTLTDKYGVVEMTQRYGNTLLPAIEIVNLKEKYKTGRVKNHFSDTMIETIEYSLSLGEQILIFQNRRGYVPTVSCQICGWASHCMNCDVSLTKHMHFQEMRCHYCGYKTKVPKACGGCGNDQLIEKGIGTEKIEDILKELFPQANVSRLDYDTAKTQSQYEQILGDFDKQKIHILVGTQMITKGLDFDNIAVVGILNADLLLQFPDFRAHERAYQLITQVSGRAGRRAKQGKVVIQTFQPEHPVILDIVDNNYSRFFNREIKERKQFIYPPYFRLIQLILKHKNAKTVGEAAQIVALELRKTLGKRVIGPSEPGINRIRGQYIQLITVKMERKQESLVKIKQEVMRVRSVLRNMPGLKSVRFNMDVDPN